MNLHTCTPFRSATTPVPKLVHLRLVVLLISALLISGCSSSDSSDSQPPVEGGAPSADETNAAGNDGATDDASQVENGSTSGNTNTTTTSSTGTGTTAGTSSTSGTTDALGTGTGAGTDSGATPTAPDSAQQNLTRVSFDITVPVYVSNALQVRLTWGDKDIAATWNSDELWTASDDFPTDTENLLVVTFYDANGDITLGTVERTFKTGTSALLSFQITADQFDTASWDSDADGISNFAESIAGTNPLVNEPVMLPSQPIQSGLELVVDKTFRITWQSATDADFYRVLENPDGISGFSQISDDLASSTQRFDHRVALYNRVNARYIVQACNAGGCVDSNEQIITGSLDRAIGYFKASNSRAGWFGDSVSLSADGNTLAISSPFEDGGSTGVNGDQVNLYAPAAGAVYLFARINGSWRQQAYLKASNNEDNDQFGGDVSLSADGNILAVSSYGEDSSASGVNGNELDNSALASGAVYVFTRINNNWQQQAYLKASNPDGRDPDSNEFPNGDLFGASLSLSGDGTTLAVGAIGEDSAATGIDGDQDDNSASNSGAAYVFEYTNGNWQQEAYIKASNTEANDDFGRALSLSANGNMLAIGALAEDSAATGIEGDQANNAASMAGAVYVFERSNSINGINDSWQQQAYLKASNTNVPGEFGKEFGIALSMSADGNTLAVGARRDASAASGINADQNDNSAEGAGAVYVFTRSNTMNGMTETWQQQAYLKASNTERFDEFGLNSISLSADGNALAVGTPYESSSATGIDGNQNDNSAYRSGAVYLFARVNTTDGTSGTWQQRAYVKASNTGEEDRFGNSVSLSADGESLAVGANHEDSNATGVNGNQLNNLNVKAGAVYLY